MTSAYQRNSNIDYVIYKELCLYASLHPKLVWIGSPKQIIMDSPVPSACAHNLVTDRSKTVL